MFPKLRNMMAVIEDQMPPKRLIRNFLITRNAWGLFYQNSHISSHSGKEKISYRSKRAAIKAADSMQKKYPDGIYKAYKCLWCDGFHVGKNRK